MTETILERETEARLQGIDDATFRKRFREAYRELKELPERLPATANLLVDNQDRLWVREYGESARSDSVSWRLYAPGGHRIGRLRVPRTLTVLAVRDTLLVCKRTDALGVESIIGYRLP